MGRDAKKTGSQEQNELYTRAVAECGRMLDRLPAGYEADPDKRRDLRQEIHLQLWRSFGAFDGRCSLKTWTLRVAHNTAASYVVRERRMNAKLISLEEIERTLESVSSWAYSNEKFLVLGCNSRIEYFGLLRRLWPTWRDALVIVKPETVVAWHRAGFRLFWRLRSRPKSPGRPKIDA